MEWDVWQCDCGGPHVWLEWRGKGYQLGPMREEHATELLKALPMLLAPVAPVLEGFEIPPAPVCVTRELGCAPTILPVLGEENGKDQ